MKNKIIAWLFTLGYLIVGFLDLVGDRDENGLFKLIGSLVILWVIYFIFKNKNFRFKEVIYFIISIAIPLVIFGSYLTGFLDALL